MALQAVGTNPFLPIMIGRNPFQTIGMLSISMFAINALSNLPIAQAKEAKFERKACEIACEPLPGGKDDVPERICVKTCEEGAEIIKTTTKEAMKDGKWKTVEVIGKVITPIGEYFDCTAICNPATGITKVGGELFGAAWKVYKKDMAGAITDTTSATAKAGCMVLLATPVGKAACLACCAGIKLAGIG